MNLCHSYRNISICSEPFDKGFLTFQIELNDVKKIDIPSGWGANSKGVVSTYL